MSSNNEPQDFENTSKWGQPMDRQAHLKSYKGFLIVSIATLVVVGLTLLLMAAFLT